jgi:phosphatidate cytidylyltransferase
MDDDRDDREVDEEQPWTFQSGRVRIIGAEPAAPPAGTEADLDAPGSPAHAAAGGTRGSAGPGGEGDADAGTPDLLHWTDAPTGEVPSVLARPSPEGSGTDDPWSSVPPPSWREGEADWKVDHDNFEPSMLANEEARLGSLDDSADADRQPWRFDLAAETDDTSTWDFGQVSDDDTIVVPAVGEGAAPGTGGALGVTDREAPDAGLLQVGDADAGVETVGADELYPDAGPAPKRATGRGIGRVGRRRAKTPPPPVGAPAAGAAAAGASVTAGTLTGTGPVPVSTSARAAGVRTGRPPAGSLRPPQPPGEQRPPGGRDMPIAIISGFALGVLVLVLFDLGTVTAMLIVTVLAFIGAAEGYAAFRRTGYHPATLLGLVATASLMIATYNKGQVALGLVIVLLLAFTFVWYLAGVERGADPVRGIGATMFVFCWIGVFASFAALLLNPNLFPHKHGIAFLLGGVIAGVAYDIGALAVGSSMGRHPLAPSISPNKTWEGLAGGAVASILASVIVVHFIHPWTLGSAFALGVVVAVVSPFGDLSESMIKRGLGIKDMGRLLPGHGGLLDRVDGMLFVLPATYFLVKAMQLG